MACTFQTTIGGKFAPLIGLSDGDMDIDTMITTYTRGQVSVNKRNSVLSNYFDVSFEIYYVRLKYIDSIGQVVKLLILRPASIYCTFKPGHIGSLER